jgi:phosphate transport system substrate-binding protein
MTMKKIIIVILILGLGAVLVGPPTGLAQKKELTGNLSISGAWALYPMVLKWAEEFQKIHPRVKIDVQAGGAGKGITDALSGMVDIGMVSRNIHPAEVEKGAFPIAVTKDAVVPTLSVKNPLVKEILSRGVKKEEFFDIWITGKIKTWGEVAGTKDSAVIHVYTRSDACGAAETWAAFLGKRQEDLGGIGVYGDPGLADAVKRDPLGVGFNNVNFAYDAKTLKPVDGIRILPIDINGNGRIDTEENVYETRDEITQAIAKNVYPSPPARELYFVSNGKPGKEVLVEFVKWVLGDGQKYVSETGYIQLSEERLAEGLEKIGTK